MTQQNYADQGYHAYRVADYVQRHTAYGVGVYSYFRDNAVWMDTGIKTGCSSSVKFTNAFNKHLNGQGGIAHVLNG